MKPAIYTNPHTLESFLVDEDSEIKMRWRMIGRHARSFETAVHLKRLKPGQFEVVNFTNYPASLVTGTPPMKVMEIVKSIVLPTPEIMAVWPEIRSHGTLPRNLVTAPTPLVYGFEGEAVAEYFHEQRRSYDDPKGQIVCRGIHLQAAEAMLRLAASWNNFKYDRVTESQAFGHARIENTAPSLPWEKWCFLCAWFWSDWQTRSHPKKVTHAQRFEEMKAAGYPHGEKAFEAMHRRLFPKPTH